MLNKRRGWGGEGGLPNPYWFILYYTMFHFKIYYLS